MGHIDLHLESKSWIFSVRGTLKTGFESRSSFEKMRHFYFEKKMRLFDFEKKMRLLKKWKIRKKWKILKNEKYGKKWKIWKNEK